MATFTVKNIPDDLYERLKQLADANRRSVNSEIIVCIEQAVRSHPVAPEAVLASARALREKTTSYRLDDEQLKRIKTEGRP